MLVPLLVRSAFGAFVDSGAAAVVIWAIFGRSTIADVMLGEP